ncbi:MAG: (d)CMP kinase [Coxiellaceae bacterium]|jgi:cytidylate kinase|nr:(d)CMP kinase [Coxiellaceae bacterium]
MVHKVPIIITIDGPVSVGKGVISRSLAGRLGWHFLDSGAIYRLLALAVIKKNISLDDIPHIVNISKSLDIKFIVEPGIDQKVILSGEDVTNTIRHEECGTVASKIASIVAVRSALIDYQRSFCKLPGLVADGRDMGTVVFPEAKLKIFLTASAKERAKRRLLQLQDAGINANLDTVFVDLVARDKRDSERTVSPLKPDPKAVIIDTTKLSIDEVLQIVMAHVKNMHF